MRNFYRAAQAKTVIILLRCFGWHAVEQAHEFHRHAAQLRTMAAKEQNRTIKDTMLGLAQQWEDLAMARQEFLLTQAKIESARKPD